MEQMGSTGEKNEKTRAPRTRRKATAPERSENAAPATPIAPPVAALRTGVGTIAVRSNLWKLDPELQKDEEIEVELFVSQPAVVSVAENYTVKDRAGYPVAKVDVHVSWPCYPEEVDRALEVVKQRVRKEIKSEARRIMINLGLMRPDPAPGEGPPETRTGRREDELPALPPARGDGQEGRGKRQERM